MCKEGQFCANNTFCGTEYFTVEFKIITTTMNHDSSWYIVDMLARSVPCYCQILIYLFMSVGWCNVYLCWVPYMLWHWWAQSMQSTFEFFAKKSVIMVAQNANSASAAVTAGHLRMLDHWDSIFSQNRRFIHCCKTFISWSQVSL